MFRFTAVGERTLTYRYAAQQAAAPAAMPPNDMLGSTYRVIYMSKLCITCGVSIQCLSNKRSVSALQSPSNQAEKLQAQSLVRPTCEDEGQLPSARSRGLCSGHHARSWCWLVSSGACLGQHAAARGTWGMSALDWQSLLGSLFQSQQHTSRQRRHNLDRESYC